MYYSVPVLPLPPGGPTRLLAQAALAALFGGAAAIERKGALQLMLSRPIVLAPLLGWALGDVQGGLVMGVPLELLFLGGVNLGGSLPDNETLLAGAVTSMVVPAGLATGLGVEPVLAALGLALLAPLAIAGRKLEQLSERRNGELAALALERVRAGDASALTLNLRGLLLPFLSAAGICAACVAVSPLLSLVRLRCPGRLALGLEGGWHVLWALAAATAIRAIRDPRAKALSALGALAVAATAVAFALVSR